MNNFNNTNKIKFETNTARNNEHENQSNQSKIKSRKRPSVKGSKNFTNSFHEDVGDEKNHKKNIRNGHSKTSNSKNVNAKTSIVHNNTKHLKITNNASTKILSHNLVKNKVDEKKFSHNRSILPVLSNKAKRITIFITIAVLIIIIGIAIGVFTFMISTNSKLAIPDDVKEQLSSTAEKNPYYMLVTADTDTNQDEVIDQMFIMHCNPKDKKITTINVPVNTYVAASSGGGTTFAKISKEKGDSELIKTVSSFVESGICHYVKTNAEGISKIIDLTGGIDVELIEQIDDPTQADKYIPSGKTTISGSNALSILRTNKFSGGSTTVSENQNTIFNGILNNLFNKNVNLAYLLDQVAGPLKTDMDTGKCINFCSVFKGIDEKELNTVSLEGSRNIRNNEMVFIADSTKWKATKQALSYGQNPPEEVTKTINDIIPSSFTIFVRNGSGTDGAAAMLSEELKSMGYNVVGTDNAEQTSYNETLIIYTDNKNKNNAEAVMNSINNGRVVNGSGLYEIQSDIMIIIGKDFKI